MKYTMIYRILPVFNTAKEPHVFPYLAACDSGIFPALWVFCGLNHW